MEKDNYHSRLSDFTMLSLLGVGNYAKVILVRRKNNGKIYAMKIVKKRKEQGQIRGIKKEHAYIQKEILNECAHPFVVKLHSTFQKHRKLYYILQYCPGGQLFGLIRRLKRFSEQSTKFYAAQIILALEYFHSKNFVYRDLKPENVLIDKKGYIKLIDFGLSCNMNSLEHVDPIAGTPEYLSPEIFQSGFNVSSAIDWWTLGNLIFQMIAGFPPFFVQQEKYQTIKSRICEAEPPLYLISNSLLKDLLEKLLDKNPKTRLGSKGASQIREHAWFYGTNWTGLLQYSLIAPFKPQLSNEIDTHLFQLQHKEMSPVQQSSISDNTNTQRYMEFSLSWKSSRERQQADLGIDSPPEIVINIRQQFQH